MNTNAIMLKTISIKGRKSILLKISELLECTNFKFTQYNNADDILLIVNRDITDKSKIHQCLSYVKLLSNDFRIINGKKVEFKINMTFKFTNHIDMTLLISEEPYFSKIIVDEENSTCKISWYFYSIPSYSLFKSVINSLISL